MEDLFKKHNARFEGIQEWPEGMPHHVLFTDNLTGSTVALRVGEVTEETVKKKLEDTRAHFSRKPSGGT